MSHRISEPQSSDAEAIARVHIDSWKQTYRHVLPEDFFSAEWQTGRMRLWTEILGTENPRRRLKMASTVHDGDTAVIGFALAGPPRDDQAQPRPLVLYSLYVLADWHGAGVGQSLLESVLGDDPAFLWVEKTNGRAQSFYRRNGFDFDGEEQVEEQYPGLVEVRMVR